jgi:uncharacterized protein YbgA (DUF1722 family)/uncharacterized protein YbbK (DUF523 family)
MRTFRRPVIVVSKCLGFAACRWNGLTIADSFVEQLRAHVEFLPVCPEVEIGLGVPREPVRVVAAGGSMKLLQPSTGLDCTERMQGFARGFLEALPEVDGFFLKSRSPSCGIKDVKLYPSAGKVAVSGKGSGFFGGEVLARFAPLPIEDEARLSDYRIREHFLTRIFLQADLRHMREVGTMRALVDFHSANKYLLMAASQSRLAVLGQIVANHEHRPAPEAIEAYAQELAKAFVKIPRFTANINVLMHALGYFSDRIAHREKAHVLESLERYRKSRVPLSVPLNILRALIVRFEEPYLMGQTFFEPYPEELLLVTDSGKGRTR